MQRERLSEKDVKKSLDIMKDTGKMNTPLYVCDSPAHRANCNTRLSVTEQPLPPYGACLLGSFNLTKYVKFNAGAYFDWELLKHDIYPD